MKNQEKNKYDYLTEKQDFILNKSSEKLNVDKGELISYLLDTEIERITDFNNVMKSIKKVKDNGE